MSQSDPLAVAVAVAVDNVEANAEAHAEPQSNQTQADTLSKLERLVLAQAVYELGSDAWTSVSSILSQHPLIPKRDDVPFSPSACQNIYHHLLRAVGLDSAEPEKQPRNAHSNNLKLAQRMYQARVLELKELILAEEARFNSVAAEIEAIRAGKWDTKLENGLEIAEAAPDRLAHSPQSEQVSAIEGSGSDLTGVSDTSSSDPQMQTDPHVPEEEIVQRQLDEDLAIPDFLPPATTPPSTHESDIEPPVALQLSPLPSPIDTDYVDDLPGSPQTPHESPDPLDIITPAEDDAELKPSPTPRRAETVQPPSSPPQILERTDSTVPAERKDYDMAEPPEIAEISGPSRVVEHLEPSEVVELSDTEGELHLDVPVAASISNPLEGETSKEEDSQIVWKDDTSIRTLSETPAVNHDAGSPLPLDGTTTSAPCTPKTDTHMTERDEASETLEMKGKTQSDEIQSEETQVKQDDEMDLEQEDVASPVTELSRCDHKRKASEAASIFSDSTRDRKRTREDSQPGDEDEPGPVRRRGRPPATDSQTSKKFQTVIIMVHSQISQHRNGNIFHNPIKTSEAPDYYDIIKRPMDLKTIKARIRDGQIASSDEFQRDVYLMFANSLMYNRPGSDIYNMAEEMMLESETQINSFRQTEGIIKGSHR